MQQKEGKKKKKLESSYVSPTYVLCKSVLVIRGMASHCDVIKLYDLLRLATDGHGKDK